MCKVIEKAKSLRGSEREVVADLIKELSVIYNERLFAEAGYPSMFVSCTEGLGYSEGAAWRRVEAAKALLIDGSIYYKLRSGELSLCTAATLAKVIKPENSTELVQKASGKSHSEVKNIAAELLPPELVKRRAESVRVKNVVVNPSEPLFLNAIESEPVNQPKAMRCFTVTLELSEEEMELIDQAQRILSTSKVKATLLGATKKLIQREQRLEILREKRRKQSEIELNGTTAFTRKSSSNISHEEAPQKNSRYITADVRHEVAAFTSTKLFRTDESLQLQTYA
jgi:hypothetical protein